MKQRILLLLVAAASALHLTDSASAAAKRSFMTIVDDMGHAGLSCFGNPYFKTPEIDRLAGEGMKFTRCFQAAPMCSPTRHCLYTGLYPVKSGAYPTTG